MVNTFQKDRGIRGKVALHLKRSARDLTTRRAENIFALQKDSPTDQLTDWEISYHETEKLSNIVKCSRLTSVVEIRKN